MEASGTYASFWQRLLAHNIDLLLLLALFYLYSFVPSLGYDAAAFLIIYVSYYTLFEASKWRATPGKKLARLKVSNAQGRFHSVLAVLLRNMLKFVSLMIFFGGFAMINFNPKKQGLHDFIAGTVVLFEEELP